MKVEYDGHLLIDHARLRSADGYALQCAVSQQVRDMFRATSVAIDARGNRRIEWPLAVPREFESQREAEEFLLDHFGQLPDTGTMTFYCGQGSGQSRRTAQAWLLSLRPRALSGTLVRVDYLFLLGPITTPS